MRLLHRILPYFCVALALPGLAPTLQAQNTTTVTVTHLLSGRNPMAYGTICAIPADVNGNPINVSSTGWGLLLKNKPLCADVTAGALTTGLPVPDAAHTTSASAIRYNFTIQEKNANGVAIGQAVLINGVPNVSGPTFPLDAYTPTVNTAAYPAGLIYTSGVPSGCTSPSIVIDQVGGAAYFCNSGSLAPLTIASTTVHATTADSATTATTASTATTATNANHATTADSATTASTATNATNATHATTADSATTANTAGALATTPSNCGSQAMTGINADGSPKTCIPASASPVGQQYKIAAFTGAGSGSSTALGQSNCSTDATGNPFNCPGPVSAPTVTSNVLYQPLQIPSATNTTLSDYMQAQTNGLASDGSFPQRFSKVSKYNFPQRAGASDTYGVSSPTVNIQSGSLNSDQIGGTTTMEKSNVAIDGFTVIDQAANQNGGAHSERFDKNTKGDNVEQVKAYFYTGRSDSDDEGPETHRDQHMAQGRRWGMQLGGAPVEDSSSFGNWMFRGTLDAGYSNVTAEGLPYVNLSHDLNVSQLGNVTNMVSYSALPNVGDITVDAGVNILTPMQNSVTPTGNSNVSYLTTSVNPTSFTAPSPTAWSSATTYPIGASVTFNSITWGSTINGNVNQTPGTNADWRWQIGPWSATQTYNVGDNVTYGGFTYRSYGNNNLNVQPNPASPTNGWMWQSGGVGIIADPSGNGGLVNVVVGVVDASVYAVSSTVPVCLGNAADNFEQTYIVATSVPNETITLSYLRQQHAPGEMAAQGGGCNYGFGMTADDKAPGALGSYGLDSLATNTTTLHNVYPVLATIGGHLIIYTNEAGSGNLMPSTEGYASNTVATAGTLSATLSGGALGALTLTNAGAANYRFLSTNPGAQRIAAYPTITFSGLSCTVMPSVTVKGYIYNANFLEPVLSQPGDPGWVAGSGCTGTPTATMQSVYPNPFHLWPMAYSFRVIDPTTISLDTTTGRITGTSVFAAGSQYLMTEAINPANWASGDHTEIEGWMSQQGIVSQQHYGFYYNDNGGRQGTGAGQIEYIEGATSPGGPTGGSFRGLYNDVPSSKYWSSTGPGPGKAYIDAPNFFMLAGLWHQEFTLPIPLGTTTETQYKAGSAIHIGCYVPTNSNADHLKPCDLGIEEKYDLFTLDRLSGKSDHLQYDDLTGVLNYFSDDTTPATHQAQKFLANYKYGYQLSHGPNSPAGNTAWTSMDGASFDAWGNGNYGDSTASESFGTVHAGNVVAGADIPLPPSVYNLGATGTTTYAYEVTAITASGETTPSGISTFTTGPATSPNMYVNFALAAGATGYNIYRTAGPGGAGRICINVQASTISCIDTGQAAGAAAPTSDTSGKLTLSGKSVTAVQGIGANALSCTGTFTSGHIVTVDANGTCVDGGAAPAAPPAHVQIVLPTTALTANTCSPDASVTLVGTKSTSTFTTGFAGRPIAINGYGSSSAITLWLWPDAAPDKLDWAICASSAITPGPLTVNVGLGQ